MVILPIWPVFTKKSYGNVRKDHLNPFRAYEPYLTCLLCSKSIFDVVEAKNAIFEKSNFTIFQKYSICGSKIKISGYPKKLHYLSYLPYKYEGIWIKTHEIRAKSHWGFFLSPHCTVKPDVFFPDLDDLRSKRQILAIFPTLQWGVKKQSQCDFARMS